MLRHSFPLAGLLLVTAPLLTAAPADRQAALVAALVDLAEASYAAGRLDEALRVLDGGAALVTRDEARPADLARLQTQRAKIVYYQASLADSNYDAAILGLRAALVAAQASGDTARVAEAQDLLGLALYSRDFTDSTHDEAQALFESALATRRRLGDGRGESETLFHLGLTSENRKDATEADRQRAHTFYEQALAAANAGGFQVEASYAYRHLAGQRQDAGDLDGALRFFEESLRLREASGYAIYVAPALLTVGDVWKAKGEPAKARALYTRALAQAESLGAQRFVARAREALAALEPAQTR